jgi:hypothetical protein
MLAAHKILVDDLEEKVRAVYAESDGDWPARVRSALAVTLDWFASDPDTARFMLVEVSMTGPAFRPVFKTEFARFRRLFDEGLEESVDPQLAEATSLAVGAMVARVYEEVVRGQAADLPKLLPDLTYGLLVPYLGEEQARAVADGA